jgi:hypothetical protein
MKKFYSRLKEVAVSKKQPLITTSLLVCVVGLYQNCQQQGEFFEKASLGASIESPTIETPAAGDNDGDIKVDDDVADVPLCENGSSTDLICNPLGGGATGGSGPGNGPIEPPSVPQARLGLIAQLYEGQNQWNNIDKYFSHGYKHQENIYFSNFNVPTRSFDEGFGYGPDDYLKNRHGEKLIEWFAIEAKGNITLPESESAGSYHLATLSDDGIRIKVSGEIILNNPNTHGATLDCASKLIVLNKGEEKPFELAYFQGPRFHIALITMIKKIDDPQAFKKSSACSTGQSYQKLIDEGYKVVSPSWYTLPAGF